MGNVDYLQAPPTVLAPLIRCSEPAATLRLATQHARVMVLNLFATC